MTPEQHLNMMAELIRIREAIESLKQTPAPSRAVSAPASTQSASINDTPPLPDTVIEDAGNVEVHFGKNEGVPLSKLSQRSLAWYAQEPEPKLDRNGNPFPPRDSDVRLRNAARTLWHQLYQSASVKQEPAKKPASKPAPSPIDDGEEVPF